MQHKKCLVRISTPFLAGRALTSYPTSRIFRLLVAVQASRFRLPLNIARPSQYWYLVWVSIHTPTQGVTLCGLPPITQCGEKENPQIGSSYLRISIYKLQVGCLINLCGNTATITDANILLNL